MWSSGLLSVFCLWKTESSICFGFASLSGSFPVEGQLEWLVKEVCGAKSCLLFIKALATCPPSSQTAENWKVTWGEALHEKITANKEIENWENIWKQRNWKLRKFLQQRKWILKSNLRSTTWDNIRKQRNWCFSRGWATQEYESHVSSSFPPVFISFSSAPLSGRPLPGLKLFFHQILTSMRAAKSQLASLHDQKHDEKGFTRFFYWLIYHRSYTWIFMDIWCTFPPIYLNFRDFMLTMTIMIR